MRRRVLRSPIGSPRSHASPEVGLSRPSRSFTEVVFPAPLGPRNPKISPRGTVIERPASATVLPNRFDRSTVCMAGESAATPSFVGVAAMETDAGSATHAGYQLKWLATSTTTDCLSGPATTKTLPLLIQITPEPRPVLSPTATPWTPCTVTLLEVAYSMGIGIGSVVL